jgi:hypothetical protein
MQFASFRVITAILPTDAPNLSIEHCPTSESYLLWSYDLGRKRMYFLFLATWDEEFGALDCAEVTHGFHGLGTSVRLSAMFFSRTQRSKFAYR